MMKTATIAATATVAMPVRTGHAHGLTIHTVSCLSSFAYHLTLAINNLTNI